MKGMRKRSSFLIGFVLLTVYIFCQLFWWAYTLISLHTENILLSPQFQNQAESMIQRKKYMVLGEGAVFLVLMLLGMYFIYRSVRKEINLAQLQKNFLLAITHELKTPIASNRLFLQTLQRGKFDSEKQSELIDKALKENTRMGYLAHNLLLATNIENHSLSPYLEKIDVSQLILSIISNFEKSWAGKRQFSTHIIPKICVQTDEQLLTSIIQNLVENAIKYSPTNSTIKINFTTDPSASHFSISNGGKGIPKEDLPFIFNRFFRVGNEETRETKGTGLGLYIVDNLCRELGATIQANSNAQETTFKLILPHHSS